MYHGTFPIETRGKRYKFVGKKPIKKNTHKIMLPISPVRTHTPLMQTLKRYTYSVKMKHG